MKTVTIVIPYIPQWPQTESLRNLCYFLSRGTPKKSSTDYLEALSDYFDMPNLTGTAMAAWTAVHDKILFSAQPAQGFWLRADPVELRADLAAVYMLGNQHLQLSEQILQRARQILESLLAPYAIQLHMPALARWYFEVNEPIKIKTVQPESIIGKDVLGFLPENEPTIPWKKLQTEIQMGLFQDEVVLPINSLWLWGAGNQLPKIAAGANSLLISDEPISLGLAKYSGMSWQPLENSMDTIQKTSKQNIVLIYDKFTTATDHALLKKYWQQLDEDYIQSLLNEIRKNRVEQIVLDFLTGTRYIFRKRNFYYLWKRTLKVMQQ